MSPDGRRSLLGATAAPELRRLVGGGATFPTLPPIAQSETDVVSAAVPSPRTIIIGGPSLPYPPTPPPGSSPPSASARHFLLPSKFGAASALE